MTTLIPKFDLKNGGSTPTGAINRTIQQKLTDVISVKDFGAIGNGIADDTASILAAVASLTSNSSLYFPQGNYLFNNGSTGFPLTGLNNVYIYGKGAQITVAKDAALSLITNCTNIDITGLKIVGTFATDLFTGNIHQGVTRVNGCNSINLYGNYWSNCTQALNSYSGDSNTNINFHHNHCDSVFAPVQLAGGLTGVNVSDNYFLGFISTVYSGSDDIIAIFSGDTNAASSITICRNFIDKQGPTNTNIAHGILVQPGSTTQYTTEVTISENIVNNVISLTGANASPAISIGGFNSVAQVYSCNIIGNIITNCNCAILVDSNCERVNVSNNQIKDVIFLAGTVGYVAGQGVNIRNNGLTYLEMLVASGNSLINCKDRAFNVSVCKLVSLSSNMIVNNSVEGLVIDQVDRIVLNGNVVCENGATGILINTSAKMSIVGNTVTNNGAYGFRIQGTGATGTVCGNTILNNTTANYSDVATGSALVLTGNAT